MQRDGGAAGVEDCVLLFWRQGKGKGVRCDAEWRFIALLRGQDDQKGNGAFANTTGSHVPFSHVRQEFCLYLVG